MAVIPKSAGFAAELRAYIESRLAQLGDFARRWDDLPEDTRDDFLLEWPIVEDKARRLEEMAREDPSVRAETSRLLERVAESRGRIAHLQQLP